MTSGNELTWGQGYRNCLVNLHRVSRWSPGEKVLHTEIHGAKGLMRSSTAFLNSDAFTEKHLQGEGDRLVYREGDWTVFVPLDQEYGFEEYVSYSFYENSNTLQTSWCDAYENILRERTELVRDAAPVKRRAPDGVWMLHLDRKQPNQQITRVTLMLDTLELCPFPRLA